MVTIRKGRRHLAYQVPDISFGWPFWLAVAESIGPEVSACGKKDALVVLGYEMVKILILQILGVNFDRFLSIQPFHVIIPHNVGVIQASQ